MSDLTIHRDDSVTYWSVYRQQWVKRAQYVSDEECAAMPEEDRIRLNRCSLCGHVFSSFEALGHHEADHPVAEVEGCWMVAEGWQIYYDADATIGDLDAVDSFEDARDKAVAYWRAQEQQARAMAECIAERTADDYSESPDDEEYAFQR